MEYYPRTVQDFESRFSTEEKCRVYLISLRWPEGFRCPHCQGIKAVLVRSTLFQCCACRRQTSATAGTIFQDTRKKEIKAGDLRRRFQQRPRRRRLEQEGSRETIGHGTRKTSRVPGRKRAGTDRAGRPSNTRFVLPSFANL